MTVSVVQAAGVMGARGVVAAPVSFTVGTTVLPSFALRAIRISGGFIVLA
jgi:hypothetical protein